jgi:hypothetical protein
MEQSRVSRAAPRAGAATVARKCGPAGPSRGRARGVGGAGTLGWVSGWVGDWVGAVC